MSEDSGTSKTEAAVKAAKADDKAADPKSNDAAQTLGIPDTFGRKGTITIDENAPIESIILAYDAVDKIADKICENVRAKIEAGSAILIHNPADFAAIQDLKVFNRQAEVALSLMNGILMEAGGQPVTPATTGHTAFAGALAAAGAIITSALQLMSLFRADHQIKNYKVDVEDQVLAMTVSGKLVHEDKNEDKNKNTNKVYNTALIPLELDAEPKESASLKKLEELKATRALLIAAGDNKLKNKDTNEKEKALFQRIVEAVKEFDAFELSLFKIDEKTGLSRMVQFPAAEAVLKLLRDEKPYILWLKAVAAGGGTHAKDTAVFSDLTYSGGALAIYALYDKSGVLKEAMPISRYAGIIHLRDLEKGVLPRFA